MNARFAAILALACLAGSCATVKPEADSRPADAPQHRPALAGTPRVLSFWYYVDPDCTSPGAPKMRIVSPPAHGKLRVIEAEGFPSFPEDNVRFECNKKRVTGTYVTYTAPSGFAGDDAVTLDVLYDNGTTRRSQYALQVFARPERIAGNKPTYPEDARINNVEGMVTAWIYVDDSGAVERVVIKQSPDERLSEAVRSAFQGWKFRPTGRFTGEYSVVFRLTDFVPNVQ